MSRGYTPRHAQTAGDLSFAVQFNDETLWHFAQLRDLNVVPLVTSFRRLNTPSTCLPWVASRIGGRRDPGG